MLFHFQRQIYINSRVNKSQVLCTKNLRKFSKECVKNKKNKNLMKKRCNVPFENDSYTIERIMGWNNIQEVESEPDLRLGVKVPSFLLLNEDISVPKPRMAYPWIHPNKYQITQKYFLSLTHFFIFSIHREEHPLYVLNSWILI